MIFQHTYKQVLSGHKTQTRRTRRPRMTVGRSYAVQPGRTKKAIARIVVTDIHQERLGDIGKEDAVAEGFDDREQFFESWERIHGTINEELEVWVIEFELVN